MSLKVSAVAAGALLLLLMIVFLAILIILLVRPVLMLLALFASYSAAAARRLGFDAAVCPSYAHADAAVCRPKHCPFWPAVAGDDDFTRRLRQGPLWPPHT